MSFTARHLAVVGVLAATAIAVPAAALAGSSPSSKAPTNSAASAPAPRVAKAKAKAARRGVRPSAFAARLASRLGVSRSAAEHAMEQFRDNMTTSQIAAIAHELGVSPERLNSTLREVKMSFAPPASGQVGPGGPKGPAPRGSDLTTLRAAAALLASRLGVSIGAAQHAMHQLGAISAREGGVESNSPQVRAIAHGLGVSPARLNRALRMVKESFAGR